MNKIKLAFCPTMERFAEVFEQDIKELSTVPAGSASEVLFMLRAGEVEAVLIGREAYLHELAPDIKKKRLHGGYTLVFSRKMALLKEQLPGIPVKTYLPAEIASEILPDSKNIEFCGSPEECEKIHPEMPMLIDWKDFKDEYKLLIPVEPNGAKDPVFRAPVIYYNAKTAGDEITGRLETVFKSRFGEEK